MKEDHTIEIKFSTAILAMQCFMLAVNYAINEMPWWVRWFPSLVFLILIILGALFIMFWGR